MNHEAPLSKSFMRHRACSMDIHSAATDCDNRVEYGSTRYRPRAASGDFQSGKHTILKKCVGRVGNTSKTIGKCNMDISIGQPLISIDKPFLVRGNKIDGNGVIDEVDLNITNSQLLNEKTNLGPTAAALVSASNSTMAPSSNKSNKSDYSFRPFDDSDVQADNMNIGFNARHGM
ncbi:unnamed protein product [Protopolystoma xenopodis]|uniref:Uncharacterized protein n=1 Tax=Protopolystoma xenopodis TaxID=117903 RepID=A0A448X687_9PLAT|nr:unnamed protein product [Protopolystoma xenopodis]